MKFLKLSVSAVMKSSRATRIVSFNCIYCTSINMSMVLIYCAPLKNIQAYRLGDVHLLYAFTNVQAYRLGDVHLLYAFTNVQAYRLGDVHLLYSITNVQAYRLGDVHLRHILHTEALP